MEIDGLGKRCALPNCRKLDYLPVQCHECHLNFCDEHALPAAHACRHVNGQDVNDGQCPQCKRHIGHSKGALMRHLRKEHARTDPSCTQCGRRDAFAVTCPRCRRLFCVEHRLLEVHACVGTTPAITRVRKKARVRTVPGNVEDLLYCQVRFEIDADLQSQSMSFSRRWSAGKILDDISKRVGLREKRRWLYVVGKADSDISQLLNNIDRIDGFVSDGDTLVVTEVRPRDNSAPSRRRRLKSQEGVTLKEIAVVDLTLDEDIDAKHDISHKTMVNGIIDLT